MVRVSGKALCGASKHHGGAGEAALDGRSMCVAVAKEDHVRDAFEGLQRHGKDGPAGDVRAGQLKLVLARVHRVNTTLIPAPASAPTMRA